MTWPKRSTKDTRKARDEDLSHDSNAQLNFGKRSFLPPTEAASKLGAVHTASADTHAMVITREKYFG